MDNNTAPTKQDFTNTVETIEGALGQHDQVYPRLIAAVAPYDRKLASLIANCAKADAELGEYLRSKKEAGETQGIVGTVIGLLLGR